MNPNFVNSITLVFPIVIFLPFILLVIYDGQIGEAIGVVIFLLMFVGHFTSLVMGVKTRRHHDCVSTCIDLMLFVSQLIFTALGAGIGIESASKNDFACFPENINTSSTKDFTQKHSRDSTIEGINVCVLNVVLFVGASGILFIRCWLLPAIQRCKDSKRNQISSENNFHTMTSPNPVARENNIGHITNIESERLSEIELSVLPLFTTQTPYPPLPSYDSIYRLEDFLPPPYKP